MKVFHRPLHMDYTEDWCGPLLTLPIRKLMPDPCQTLAGPLTRVLRGSKNTCGERYIRIIREDKRDNISLCVLPPKCNASLARQGHSQGKITHKKGSPYHCSYLCLHMQTLYTGSSKMVPVRTMSTFCDEHW